MEQNTPSTPAPNQTPKLLVALAVLVVALGYCIYKLQSAEATALAASSKLRNVEAELAKATKALEASKSDEKTAKSLVGVWHCRTTLPPAGLLGVATVAELKLTLSGDGQGSFVTTSNGSKADDVHGKWGFAGKLIVVTKQGGGFASFLLATHDQNRLNLINRSGQVFEFNRLN